ncbi:MAG: S-layer homology domain-containing protein [Oscillospiraceae bacterium]|nr:S-layer homology domain-containing protein [Oscillospiraceae bacterium]
MKKMKRALSLLLTLAMVLGMMAMGGTGMSAGAVSQFADADEIVYKEAVEITAGIGLFAGSGGKFLPKGTVTRAQMATIVVKMIYGSDFNADSFKGTKTFSDTTAFEGGWAEGYINACVQLGVVAGYGDGTFKPGKAVTAAEAVTMIINALKVDAGEGTWPVTVMAKAEEIKLFEDLKAKPASDTVLTRDELAVVSLNGLFYSPEGTNSYAVGDKKFESAMDAYLYASSVGGTVDTVSGFDSLAGKVYEIKTASGTIVANQAFGEEGTKLSDGSIYDIETDLDDIGHYVTVYYKEAYESEEEPGETYAIVDEAKYVALAEEAETAKEYKDAFGKNYTLADGGWLFDGSYSGQYQENSFDVDGYVAGSAAPAGTYVIYEGKITGYIAPAMVYATRIVSITTSNGVEKVTLNGVSAPLTNDDEGDDQVVQYTGMAKDDYVTYVKIGQGASAMYVLTKMETVNGVIRKTSVDEDGVTVLTMSDGKSYKMFTGANTDNKTNLDTSVAGVDYTSSYDLYLTPDGRVAGFESSTNGVDLKTTVYLLGALTTTTTNSYGDKIIQTRGRGVDMSGNEVMLLLAVGTDKNRNGTIDDGETTVGYVDGAAPVVSAGFYSVEEPTDRDEKKEGIKKLVAFPTTYDKDASPIYAKYNRSVSNTTMSYNGFTADGSSAFRKSSSVFILIEGTLEQGQPLQTEMKTGNGPANLYITGSITTPLILSRTEGGAREVEVMVIPYNLSATSTETIYVSEADKRCESHSAEGSIYNVYEATTGAAKQIVLDNGGVDLVPGFYTVRTEDGIQVLSDAKVPEPVVDTVAGNQERYDEDGLYRENVFYNLTMNMFHDKYMTAGKTNGTTVLLRANVSSAKIVDTRDEKTVEEQGIGNITSMEQIVALRESNPELCVMMDVCFSSYNNTTDTIFISRVEDVRNNYMTLFIPEAVGHKAGEAPTTLTESVDAYVVRSFNEDHPVGSTITIASGTSVSSPNKNDKFSLASDNLNNTGFVTWIKNDEAVNGYELALIRSSTSSSSGDGYANDFTLGYHNLMVSYEDGVLTTIDAHAINVDGVVGTRCYYGYGPCSGYLSTSAQPETYEHTVVNVADDVQVFYNGAQITVNELVALFDNGSKNVLLNYYCPNGEPTTNIIIVDEVTDNGGVLPYAPLDGELMYLPHSIKAGTGGGNIHVSNKGIMLTGEAAGSQVRTFIAGVVMPDGVAAVLPTGIFQCKVGENNLLVLEQVSDSIQKLTSVPTSFIDKTGEIDDAAELASIMSAGDYFVYGYVYGDAAVITELRDAVVAADADLLAMMDSSTVITDESGNSIDSLARLTAVVNKTTVFEAEAMVKYTEASGKVTAVTVKSVNITDANAPALWSTEGDAWYNFLYAAENVANADGTVTPGEYRFYSFEGANLNGGTYMQKQQYKGLLTIPVVGLASAAEKPLAAADRGGFYVVSGITVDGVILRKGVNDDDGDFGLRFAIHRKVTSRASSKVTAQFTTACGAPDAAGQALRINHSADCTSTDACYTAGVCTPYASQNTFTACNVDTYIINLTDGSVKVVGTDYSGATSAALYNAAAAAIPVGAVIDYAATTTTTNPTVAQFRWCSAVFIREVPST